MARKPSRGPRSQLGRYIFTQRTAMDLSQQDLADKSGYSRGYIARVERQRVAPTVSEDFIEKVAVALGVSAETLRREGGLKQRNPFDIDTTGLSDDEKGVVEQMRNVKPSRRALKAWIDVLPVLEESLGIASPGEAATGPTQDAAPPPATGRKGRREREACQDEQGSAPSA